MPQNKKTILITGGAGFIGSHLAEKLLQGGQEVWVIDNLSTGSLKNLRHLKRNQKFHFVRGSVLEKRPMGKLIRKADQIYHLAASVGVKTIMERPLESFLNNIKGTETVLDLALKRRVPVLLTSSSEVYGKNDGLPFKEESDRVYGSAYSDRWGYALSKAGDEFLALAYFRQKKLPVVVVRLFNVIGPRQSEAYGMVVPRFVKQALSGKPITIYGNGYQSRCFADIEDVTEGLIKLINHPKAIGQIFNLGSEEEITIKALARKIKTLARSQSPLTYVPYSRAYGSGFEDMTHRQPDLSRIKKVIKYKPQYTLEQSLLKIIRYYRAG